eukprot:TRINITY_DN4582_c0_g2_i2.p2 TRINITY_DN4582_c0_g2~~TRINITY_DN4582_c0_g2_i2.p2  ORF type:complete len:426 (-),score=93.78 TRINITY_DN4582_c0_g2_i2:980-2257(-)
MSDIAASVAAAVPPRSEPRPQGSRYRITSRVLGEGSTGKVLVAERLDGPGKAAVKVISKRSALKQEAMREIRTLIKLSHKNVIKILHIEEDARFVYMYTEHMGRGDLFAFINLAGPLKDEDARTYFRQMAGALQYCHSKRICHHDFKLENCVINERKELRVIDFGYAMHVPEGSLIREFPGSPAYSAPEVLFRQPHGLAVDVFSLGVSLYYMLCGVFPFCDPETTTLSELCDNVQRFQLTFPKQVSPPAQDLIRRMLARFNRISWDDINKHPWLAQQDTLKLLPRPATPPRSMLKDRLILSSNDAIQTPTLSRLPSIEAPAFSGSATEFARAFAGHAAAATPRGPPMPLGSPPITKKRYSESPPTPRRTMLPPGGSPPSSERTAPSTPDAPTAPSTPLPPTMTSRLVSGPPFLSLRRLSLSTVTT